MIPWRKLPQEVQQSLLALIVLSSSASVMSSCAPTICDPAPPPTTARPTPIRSPIICDPAPPPSVERRPTTLTPPPTANPEARTFRVLRLEINPDPAVTGARLQGRIVDQAGRPLAGETIYIAAPQASQQVVTDPNGAFDVELAPGTYLVTPDNPQSPSQSLELKPHDVADIEWQLLGPTPVITLRPTPMIFDPAPPPATRQPTRALPPTPMIFDPAPAPAPSPFSRLDPAAPSEALPLAEIRTVEIVWTGGLGFDAETPWPEAKYRWSTSGGELIQSGGHVEWQPPSEPGQYLVQVAANWGPMGLAVDSIVLTVQSDGSVMIG